VVERDGRALTPDTVAFDADGAGEDRRAFVSDRLEQKSTANQNDRTTNLIGEGTGCVLKKRENKRRTRTPRVGKGGGGVNGWRARRTSRRRAAGPDARENPLLDEAHGPGGTKDALYEDVKMKVDVQYGTRTQGVDGRVGQTEAGSGKYILPTRVKVTLTAMDENGRERTYVTRTRVMIKTEMPRGVPVAPPRQEARGRGVAMADAIISIAILTVVATVAYSARVDLGCRQPAGGGCRRILGGSEAGAGPPGASKFQKQSTGTPSPTSPGCLQQFAGAQQAAPRTPPPRRSTMNSDLADGQGGLQHAAAGWCARRTRSVGPGAPPRRGDGVRASWTSTRSSRRWASAAEGSFGGLRGRFNSTLLEEATRTWPSCRTSDARPPVVPADGPFSDTRVRVVVLTRTATA